MKKTYVTMDANEAVASVAYRLNEVIAIYPITPATPMGEWADEWASRGKPNLWGGVPEVVEMQSEAGAAGTLHGALQAGALATTFTASQGLLLMIPNMIKIAGELTPTVIHVAARSLAAQALSIFGDHSDVMAARTTGFAFLCSGSVQEAMDFALVAQAASLKSRVPFIHFFDGFRTSHEIAKVEPLRDEDLQRLLNEEDLARHRARSLSPDRPVLRGTSQNPDVYFQSREAANRYYEACPGIVSEAMEEFEKQTGRRYRLFDYYGAPDAERVLVVMGSAAEAVHEVVDDLKARKEKVGVLRVRLYRPFDGKSFLAALPPSVKKVAVLDRTKEPGSGGEPLYLDCVNAFHEGLAESKGWPKKLPQVVGGRYGLSSKEFTPGMIASVFENLKAPRPKNHFTVGIRDDVTHTSLSYDPHFSLRTNGVFEALFYGLGSDGTVGANKNTIKIIGESTASFVQGYFVYDSKKAGAITVSHLRFGPSPIRSSYLITQADFIGCHQPFLIERYDLLQHLKPGGTLLLNTPYPASEIWARLPRTVQEGISKKKARFFIIDAYRVARESGSGSRINTVMQVCFFSISGVLPRDEAMEKLHESIRKSYGRKGEEVVQMNLRAVDHALEHLSEVEVPVHEASGSELPSPFPPEAPRFVREVLGEISADRGNELPVSAFPVDGTYPTGTSKWEKREIAAEIPEWDLGLCIQCGKCALVCPHAAIRIKVSSLDDLRQAPATLKHREALDREWKGLQYMVQVAPDDCMGCSLCVDVCPAADKVRTGRKALEMKPRGDWCQEERKHWEFFTRLPEMDRRNIKTTVIRQQQLQEPLFEFSSACAGCGETPYLKLVTQLFGDRMVVANATGCSSIYGGNLPTTPWAQNREGRGPAWSNYLFEDNAEFGFGLRLAIDHQRETASKLLRELAPEVGGELAEAVLQAHETNEAEIYNQRERVRLLKERLAGVPSEQAKKLAEMADLFVKKSVWIIGGDGWAYDIGFGGLDHVLASGRNVNVLVLDTEVYSNTGGQMSKGTPKGAVAKFASEGKGRPKKDLGLMAMTYGNVYVARVAFGAKDEQTLRAFLEAEAYEGPSLIIAYSHCVAHGIDIAQALQRHKAVVDSGEWPLYRFHPERLRKGEAPLTLDSAAPRIPVRQFMEAENRFQLLFRSHPEKAEALLKEAQEDVDRQRRLYEYLSRYKEALKPDEVYR